jgi:hypothetical protein
MQKDTRIEYSVFSMNTHFLDCRVQTGNMRTRIYWTLIWEHACIEYYILCTFLHVCLCGVLIYTYIHMHTHTLYQVIACAQFSSCLCGVRIYTYIHMYQVIACALVGAILFTDAIGVCRTCVFTHTYIHMYTYFLPGHSMCPRRRYSLHRCDRSVQDLNLRADMCLFSARHI